MYKGSPVLRSRKFPFLLNLPTGWFHSECLCPHSLPLLSLISTFGSSAEQSKNSSSSESTKQSRSERYSHCVHQQTNDWILNISVGLFNLWQKSCKWRLSLQTSLHTEWIQWSTSWKLWSVSASVMGRFGVLGPCTCFSPPNIERKIYSTSMFQNTRRSKSHTNIIWTYFPSEKLLTIDVETLACSNMFSVGWISMNHLSGVSHVQNFQNIHVCFFMNTALSINRTHC